MVNDGTENSGWHLQRYFGHSTAFEHESFSQEQAVRCRGLAYQAQIQRLSSHPYCSIPVLQMVVKLPWEVVDACEGSLHLKHHREMNPIYPR